LRSTKPAPRRGDAVSNVNWQRAALFAQHRRGVHFVRSERRTMSSATAWRPAGLWLPHRTRLSNRQRRAHPNTSRGVSSSCGRFGISRTGFSGWISGAERAEKVNTVVALHATQNWILNSEQMFKDPTGADAAYPPRIA